MAETRMDDPEALMDRLEGLLGRNSLLLWRLKQGLRTGSETLVTTAMESLRLYPTTVRSEVEDEVLRWLLASPGRAAEGGLAGAD
jgi:hypothetical protein